MLHRRLFTFAAVLSTATLCSCLRAGFDDASGKISPADGASEMRVDLAIADGPASDGSASDGTLLPDGAACTPRTQSLSITNNADDGEIDWPTLFDSGETFHPDPADWLLYLGYWQSGEPAYTWGYFRFTLTESLSAGASIESAELGLWGAPSSGVGTWDEGQHALRILLEASSSAAIVTVAEEAPDQATGRPLGGPSVRWPASGGLIWKLNDYNTSPDLGPMLEELIGTVGALPAGATLQFWIRGDFVGEDAEVATCDTGQPAGCSPTSLTIKWCE